MEKLDGSDYKAPRSCLNIAFVGLKFETEATRTRLTMIDIKELQQAALLSVDTEIAVAATRRRAFDEGETTDKALWSEVRAAALAGMDSVFEFDLANASAYFRRFPELASRPAPRGPIGAGLRRLVLELALEQMDEEVQSLHAAQFDKYGSASVKVWSTAAMRLIRNHGDPVSKNMRDNVDAVADDAPIEVLDGARETLDYVATRIEAHAEYQLPADRAGYETLARRLREAIEFLEIKISLEAEHFRAPVSAAPVHRM